MVLPVDDRWWLTRPNGWNCRCTVMSLSERDLAQYGLKVSESAPSEGTVLRMVRGRPVETPWGIDPEFGFNPGVVGLRLPEAHGA